MIDLFCFLTPNKDIKTDIVFPHRPKSVKIQNSQALPPMFFDCSCFGGGIMALVFIIFLDFENLEVDDPYLTLEGFYTQNFQTTSGNNDRSFLFPVIETFRTYDQLAAQMLKHFK
jgi:hypothetical protein